MFSPLISNPGRVCDEYIHITDWLPTLYKLAGGDLSKIGKIDGMDQWSTLNGQKSKRDRMLINIDEIFGLQGAIMGKYKFIEGL